jgi:Ca-activated chloride channel family protein
MITRLESQSLGFSPRGQARQTDKKAKGQTASLLKQQQPNVFQMDVAKILPGDPIVSEMSSTALLKPTDGIYGFFSWTSPKTPRRPHRQLAPQRLFQCDPVCQENQQHGSRSLSSGNA